jgi:peptide/nickel transport system permease protein
MACTWHSTKSVASKLSALANSETLYPLRQSWTTVAALVVLLLFISIAVLAPFVSPQNSFDLSSLRLLDSLLPPAWMEGGQSSYLLGTDDQGRDLLSAIFYGLRTSLGVGLVSVFFASAIGVTLGLISGFIGGILDRVIMRIAEVQQSFPAIMIALLLDGFLTTAMPAGMSNERGYFVVIIAMSSVYWVQYARTVRGSVFVEKNKDYVAAARLIGRPLLAIMFQHVLINVTTPVMVIATINLSVAIITESTLSFLGVGVPPTQPSLGSLIRVGYNFLFSGEWWIVLFPGLMLALLSLSVNLVGDWLRDTLNPKLR